MKRLLFGSTAIVLIVVALAIAWRSTRDTPNPAPVTSRPEATGGDMAGMTMSDGSVKMSPTMARSIGVTVIAAELGSLDRSIRTTGVVAYDETRLATVAPKFAGFVEQLYVNFTGQAVRKGQPMLEIYAPDLVAAQEELLGALRMRQQLREEASQSVVQRAGALVDAARRRLLLWDVPEEQVHEIERTGSVHRTLTIHAPFGGFVTERMIQAGQAVEAGMPMYRLADLSQVWIEADVYEQDLRHVRVGEAVNVEIAAYPGERFSGRVSYIHPEVQADTRTAKIRVELANPGGRIKPGMFVTVHVAVKVAERAVMVPRDAVLHSGTRAMVFVEEAPGSYRVREVTVGVEADGLTQIVSGLIAGEKVVSRANFLLDSESRLMENMGSMPGMEH